LGASEIRGKARRAEGRHSPGHVLDAGGSKSLDRHIRTGLGKGQGDALANAAPSSYYQHFLPGNVELGDTHPALPFSATTNKLSRFTRPKLRSNTAFAHQNHWFLTTIGNRFLLPATPWIGGRCVKWTRLKPFRSSNLLMIRME